jgi:hypothetical protein
MRWPASARFFMPYRPFQAVTRDSHVITAIYATSSLEAFQPLRFFWAHDFHGVALHGQQDSGCASSPKHLADVNGATGSWRRNQNAQRRTENRAAASVRLGAQRKVRRKLPLLRRAQKHPSKATVPLRKRRPLSFFRRAAATQPPRASHSKPLSERSSRLSFWRNDRSMGD